MLNEFWKSLKSGTDIRGVAADGVVGESINLTDEVVYKIAAGFGEWITEKLKKEPSEIKIAVGHDSRISADRLKNTTVAVLSTQGFNVLDCGLSSTPAMFMTTVDLSCDAAIEITASHHPFNRNGFKFFTKNGGVESSEISEILEKASEIKNFKQLQCDNVEKIDYMKIYSKRLRDLICKEINAPVYDKPLQGFKIVVDAGNGAGGFYATQVLEELGADISGSQFLEPDGMFKNHIPNPEDKTAMSFIKNATIKNKADMGIIFDTDVDRAGAVDSDGTEINRNSLVALAASIALEGNAGGTIVTDSITSDGLKKYIENVLKGKHCRFKRGYKNVINEAIRLNKIGVNCPLAIETSGHAAMRENYFLDDGAYLITKIVIKLAKLRKENKNISDILNLLEKPAESFEYRLKINSHNFKEEGEKIISYLECFAREKNWCVAQDSQEGVRISFDKNNGDGWALLRLSVHDPVMPLNIESDSKNGSKLIIKNILEALESFKFLDLNSLKENM